MTLSSNMNHAHNAEEVLPLSAYSSADIDQFIQDYQLLVQQFIDVLNHENEMIKDYSMRTSGKADYQIVLQKKDVLSQDLTLFHTSFTQMMDENILSASQMKLLRQSYKRFYKAMQENLSYLDLAQALNETILGYFIDAHGQLNKYSYNAFGHENSLTNSDTVGFLNQNA